MIPYRGVVLRKGSCGGPQEAVSHPCFPRAEVSKLSVMTQAEKN